MNLSNLGRKAGKRAGSLLRNGTGAIMRGTKNSIKSLVSSGFGLKAPAMAVSNVVSRVADYVHVSRRVTAGVLSLSMVLGGGSAVFAMSAMDYQDFLARQEYYEEPCETKEEDLVGGTSLLDGKNMQIEYAFKVWSVCKYFGWSDECAAGLLGNMQCESGIDPTCIEGIYGNHQRFRIDTPKKKAALKDLCAYCRRMFDTTYRNWKKIDKSTGHHYFTTRRGCTYVENTSGNGGTLSIGTYGSCDGHFGPGLGMVQSTGDRCGKLLSYANSTDQYNWYDLELQLAYHFDTTGGDGRAKGFTKVAPSKNFASVADASNWVSKALIGHKGSAARCNASQKWYDRFKGQTGDRSFAESIVKLANSIQGGALAGAVQEAEETCEVETEDNNSDLARAAVAYAYEHPHIDRGSDMSNGGTALYQYLHDNVFGKKSPGWYKYKSCDISVATAVRWSDADDSFPHGNTSVQDPHMQKQAKWEFVGYYDKMSVKDLKPGDILITTRDRRIKYKGMGHVVMYVSNEIVREKYPSSNAMFVSGSWGSRAPNVENGNNGAQFKGDNYYVYRLKTELADYKSGKYKDIHKQAPGHPLANTESGYKEYQTKKS